MNEEAVQNFIKQIHDLWVVPEISRRNFTDQIYGILIIFKPGGTEILFNGETRLRIEINQSVGGKLKVGAPVTVEEFAKHKIKNIKVPEDIFNNYGFIAAVTINNQWTIYFNFAPNKKEAGEKIELAEEFIKAAESVTNKKVKLYNLFQALEQAIHSTLLTHPVHEKKVKKNKSHGSIKAMVNIGYREGNIPKQVSELFNKLFENRSTIYSPNETTIDVSKENIDLVKNYISNQKIITTQK